MAYDVFLVSAREDADQARLIVRRLRALKFRVWHDAKYEDETFDAREARAALDSRSVLVLWSRAAVKSDWVRAAAAVGKSKPGLLVQSALDGVVPYEPYASDARYGLDGLTTRATPEPFYQLAEELGRRDGRADLRQWMSFGARDDDARTAWIEAHGNDPIAREDQKKKERAAAIGLAAAARGEPVDDTGEPDDDMSGDEDGVGSERLRTGADDFSDVRRIGSYGKGVRPPVEPATPVSEAMPAAERGTYLNPPYTRAQTATANGGTTRLAGTVSRAGPLDDEHAGAGTLAAIAGMIALMLFAGWAYRSAPVTTSLNGTALQAIANARMPGTCPAGTVPAYLVRAEDPASQPLQHGVIIDDTQ